MDELLGHRPATQPTVESSSNNTDTCALDENEDETVLVDTGLSDDDEISQNCSLTP